MYHAPHLTFDLSRFSLPILLVFFCVLALAWNFAVPAYENLDELEHVEVIRHIALVGRLPVHGAAEAAGFHVRQEASQPPLYHVLGAVWARALNLPLDPPQAEPIPSLAVACGLSDTFYNKATWARDPYAGFPWASHVRLTHGLRLLSTLLQLATLIGAWTLARQVFPAGPLPALAVAIVAFNPQFLLVAAGVNNDNLVAPLATWALVVLTTLWQRGPTPRRLLGFGALAGLAALSKLSGLALLGLVAATLLIYAWRARIPFKAVLGWGVLIGLPALLFMSPWLLRNYQLYGDVTALAPMLDVVGLQRDRVDFWGAFQLMYRSYWGQLPCTFYPRALYWPFLMLVLGGGAGLAFGWRRLTAAQRALLYVLGGWFLLVVAAWIRWNAITPATGGRLLFPAAPALALLLAAGWSSLRRLVWAWSAFLPVWATVALLLGPMALFAPPAQLPADAALPNPVDFTFGDSLRLRGYDARIAEPDWRCYVYHSGYCRPTLDVTFYWQADAPPAADWMLALQLVSARPGDTGLRLRYDAWPGHGNLPTSRWPAGVILKEHYTLPLPAGDWITQAWRVQVAFYELESERRLPVQVGGVPVGDAAGLAVLRAPDKQPMCIGTALTPPVSFAEAVALTQAEVLAGAETWQVALCWESLAALPDDYTVFVHAYAADGTLLGVGDGPPLAQAFPTHLWQPGDRIADTHTIVWDVEGKPAQIAVGLYHPLTGERLSAIRAGERLPADAVIIWEP